MIIQHVCSALLVFYPIYDDIKTQKIQIFPGICLIILGTLAGIISGDKIREEWLFRILPGVLSILIGQLFRRCIGVGDGFLIGGIGIIEGVDFCCCMLLVSGTVIFLFSVGMLALGKLRRTSRVACVPFLAIGYIGAWFL